MPDRSSRTPGSRRSLAIAAAGLLLIVVGTTSWTTSSHREHRPAPVASAQPRTGTTARPVHARWVPGAPRRLVIPALRVDAPVIPVAAPSGTLVPPSDPQTLGWWAAGARPGGRRGSTLIAGHTVHNGGGALDHLRRLRPGDRIFLRTRAERIRYRVVSVRDFRKGTIAQRARSLFSQHVAARLVVVTCTDWNGVRYLSNTVVTARPSP